MVGHINKKRLYDAFLIQLSNFLNLNGIFQKLKKIGIIYNTAEDIHFDAI